MKTGDVVPYRNSHGKVCTAEVIEVVLVGAGKFWFRGTDVKTKAKVWYSCSISEKLVIPIPEGGQNG